MDILSGRYSVAPAVVVTAGREEQGDSQTAAEKRALEMQSVVPHGEPPSFFD